MRYFALILILLTLAACGGTYAATAEEAAAVSPSPTPIATPAPTPEPVMQSVTITPVDSVIYIITEDASLHEEPCADTSYYGIIPEGTWIRVYEYRNDGWYRVRVPVIRTPEGPIWQQFGYMAAEKLIAHLPPEPWELPDVEISDFGIQVTEEFLSQFVSMFPPHTDPYDWNPAERLFTQIDDGFYDLYGNRIPDDAPFIRDLGIGYSWFIASHFWLYDLDGDGIPEIVIMFLQESWGYVFFYRFIDGEFIAVDSDFGGTYRFYRNERGDLIAQSGSGFRPFDADGNIKSLEYDLHHTGVLQWGIDIEEQGFLQIPSLIDLENAIRESITERLF